MSRSAGTSPPLQVSGPWLAAARSCNLAPALSAQPRLPSGDVQRQGERRGMQQYLAICSEVRHPIGFVHSLSPSGRWAAGGGGAWSQVAALPNRAPQSNLESRTYSAQVSIARPRPRYRRSPGHGAGEKHKQPVAGQRQSYGSLTPVLEPANTQRNSFCAKSLRPLVGFSGLPAGGTRELLTKSSIKWSRHKTRICAPLAGIPKV